MTWHRALTSPRPHQPQGAFVGRSTSMPSSPRPRLVPRRRRRPGGRLGHVRPRRARPPCLPGPYARPRPRLLTPGHPPSRSPCPPPETRERLPSPWHAGPWPMHCDWMRSSALCRCSIDSWTSRCRSRQRQTTQRGRHTPIDIRHNFSPVGPTWASALLDRGRTAVNGCSPRLARSQGPRSSGSAGRPAAPVNAVGYVICYPLAPHPREVKSERHDQRESAPRGVEPAECDGKTDEGVIDALAGTLPQPRLCRTRRTSRSGR
ncbi:hypothetical protein FBY22_0737 [Streptomyces sp. SLBN-31]|nr:hypothetical protein FBY22_0737 [Streptomyces sp. SLBN-31]